MAKKRGKAEHATVENRVYLFESLASSYIAAAAEQLGAEGPERERAMRALADLAYVSCVLADSTTQTPEEVATTVLSGPRREARGAAIVERRSRKRSEG